MSELAVPEIKLISPVLERVNLVDPEREADRISWASVWLIVTAALPRGTRLPPTTMVAEAVAVPPRIVSTLAQLG